MARRIPRTADKPYPLDHVHENPAAFDENRGSYKPEDMIVIRQESGDLYGYTPDGEGFYWYDTDEEMFADRL